MHVIRFKEIPVLVGERRDTHRFVGTRVDIHNASGDSSGWHECYTYKMVHNMWISHLLYFLENRYLLTITLSAGEGNRLYEPELPKIIRRV